MATITLNAELSCYNSFGVEARADRLVEWDSADDLTEVLAATPDIIGGRWEPLGSGNNTLFRGDFHGTLLHCPKGGIRVTDECSEWVDVRAEAGELWDNIVDWSVGRGLWGAENLSLIPSSAAASAVQNIGAYGAEARDTILSVEMIDVATLKRVVLANEYCSFGYRDSIFKHTLRGRVVITAVNYRFHKTPQPKLGYGTLRTEVEKLGSQTVENIRTAVSAIRRVKLPDPKVTGNAGSFFTNPVTDRCVAEQMRQKWPDMPIYDVPTEPDKVKLAAGWLIEQAGWKGYRGATVGVHQFQALVLINLGGATGDEVMALAERIANDVESKFAIAITPEVNIIQ